MSLKLLISMITFDKTVLMSSSSNTFWTYSKFMRTLNSYSKRSNNHKSIQKEPLKTSRKLLKSTLGIDFLQVSKYVLPYQNSCKNKSTLILWSETKQDASTLKTQLFQQSRLKKESLRWIFTILSTKQRDSKISQSCREGPVLWMTISILTCFKQNEKDLLISSSQTKHSWQTFKKLCSSWSTRCQIKQNGRCFESILLMIS